MMVSIIIPVYNSDKYLVQCLESVVNQSYKNLEIIIINDASTDNSKTIIDTYSKNYKNIKVIEHEQNRGLSAARNSGMDIASGHLLYFVDSDDYLDIDAIKKLVNIYLNYKTGIVECEYRHMIGHYNLNRGKDTHTVIENIDKNKELIYNRTGVCWNKLYNHDFVGDLRFPEGYFYEDTAFVYPLLTKVKNIALCKEQLYTYRRNLGSITISGKLHPSEKILDLFNVTDVVVENCKKIGTYDDYKQIIDDLIKAKLVNVLYEAETWFSLPTKKRVEFLQLIYSYIMKLYDIKDLKDLGFVKARIEQDIVYKARYNVLKGYFKIFNADSIVPECDYLGEARKIIREHNKNH